jgi:DNA helicase HerA-like ATPase
MHNLVLGMTESGKSELVKRIIKEARSRGIKTIVLDPMHDPGFNADFQTDNPVEFENIWKISRSCFCFVDETGAVGKFSESIREAATRGRHRGHSFFFLAQKATQIEPLVRDQCGGLFLFRSGLQSRKILAEEFDLPELLESVSMLEYHHAERSGYKGRGKITFNNRAGKK